jgi:hypothetical protein
MSGSDNPQENVNDTTDLSEPNASEDEPGTQAGRDAPPESNAIEAVTTPGQPETADVPIEPADEAIDEPIGEGGAVEDPARPQVAMVSAASADSSASDLLSRYFPAEANATWEYQVQVFRSGREPQEAKATKSIAGTKTVAGKEYVRFVTESPLRAPDQLYRIDSDGVYAVVQGTEGKEMLVLPARPDIKKQWSGDAVPVIKGLKANAAMGEVCKTDAGEFKDCIHVAMEMTVVARTLFGQSEDPVRFDRWFAPGVGMVKEIREGGVEGKANYLKTISTLTRWND